MERIKSILQRMCSSNKKETNIRDLLNRGLEEYANANYENAIDSFNQIIILYPQHAAALYHKGLSYRAMGDHNAAADSFMDFYHKHPQNALALENFHLYEEYINLKQEAARFPDDYHSLYRLALYRINTNEIRLAIENLTSIREISPLLNVSMELAVCYEKINDLYHLENEMRTYVSHYPEDVNGLIYLASTLEVNSKYNEALQYCKMALKLNPISIDALHLKAFLYMQLGKYSKAKQLLREINENPIFRDAREKSPELTLKTSTHMADCNFLMGNYEEAQPAFDFLLNHNINSGIRREISAQINNPSRENLKKLKLHLKSSISNLKAMEDILQFSIDTDNEKMYSQAKTKIARRNLDLPVTPEHKIRLQKLEEKRGLKKNNLYSLFCEKELTDIEIITDNKDKTPH